MRFSQVSPLLLACLALAALAALGPQDDAARTPSIGGTASTEQILRQIANATAADLGVLRELALGAADPVVVLAALAAMGRLGALARDDQVAVLLHDPRPRVRQEYVRSLGLATEPLAVARLHRIATAPDAELRPLALQSLGRIGPTALAVLEELHARTGWNASEQASLGEALERARAPGQAPKEAR